MVHTAQGDVSRLLDRWRDGDEEALPSLVDLVQDELHSLASAFVRRESDRAHRLETAELVNEVYLRLANLKRISARSRAQFFSLASRIVRNVLVDHARSHLTAKRGAGVELVSLDDARPAVMQERAELVALHEALKILAATFPQQAQILVLSQFGGLTREEIAEAMGISVSTVARGWHTARSWLYRYLTTTEPQQADPPIANRETTGSRSS